MASEQDVTSDSLDASVVGVPKELLGYVKSSIIDYINKATPEQFSAKIHYVEGQSPKLEVSCGGNQNEQAPSSLTKTNTIIVKNVPASADEELLEVFFESTKKQGGGPVRGVKILADKHVAFVEFCESSAVETVLKKRPIKFGKAELDVKPFKSLLLGTEKIKHMRVDFTKLSDKFTDELLQKQLEGHLPVPVPDYGPELFAMLKIGSRIVRGRDWNFELFGDEDGPGGHGTVTEINADLRVYVKWDNGKKGYYNMGKDGLYRLKLAP